MPLIKYAVIALQFGHKGEGGPFAVYTALYPAAEASRSRVHYIPDRVLIRVCWVFQDEDKNRVLTGASEPLSSSHHSDGGMLQRGGVKASLFAWVLFGTCLTISDGLLTPASPSPLASQLSELKVTHPGLLIDRLQQAVSVVSAVVGISVAAPSVADKIVPISIAILVVLFLVQPFGTNRISSLFAPAVFVWLALCAVSGIINVCAYPGIFRGKPESSIACDSRLMTSSIAFDPSRAIMLFVRTKSFDLLAGILLAITGVEALFAK